MAFPLYNSRFFPLDNYDTYLADPGADQSLTASLPPARQPQPVYGNAPLLNVGGYQGGQQDLIDASLGIQPPTPLPEIQNDQQEPGGIKGYLRGFLEHLGQGYQPIAATDTTSGLASGLLGGLAARGSAISQRKAKHEAVLAQRRVARDAANLKATEDYQQSRQQGIAELGKETRTAARTAAADAAKQYTLTPDDLTRIPSLARAGYKPGDTVSNTFREKLATPEGDSGKSLAQIKAEAQARAEGTAAGAGDEVPKLSEAALNGLADQYAVVGNGAIPPGGRGKERTAFVQTIVERAYQRHPDSNFATTQAGFAADRSSRVQLQRQADAQKAFIRTLDKNADLAETTLKDLPDTGTTFGNWALRGGLRALGSTQVTDFNAGLEVVRNEAARILKGGLSGGGQLSDSAKKELDAMAGNDFTKDQLRHVIKIIKQDSENKNQSYADQLAEIDARMRNAGKNGPASAAVQADYNFDPTNGPNGGVVRVKK